MKPGFLLFICLVIILAACTPAPAASPTITASPSPVPPTSTPRARMLPTWTPAPTLTPRATLTPRPTSTSRFLPTSPYFPFITPSPENFYFGELLDRPTYASLPQPPSLVSLIYDPNQWTLNTYYPTSFMGYSLNHASVYNCKLEPSVGRGDEGYQVEHYNRPLGSTTYEIARFSQAGVLVFANYCTGEGEDYTCYQMTPGDDHEACTIASEAVLATYQLIANPFFSAVLSSPNRWACQDEAGTVGLCQVSFSVPLNALAFTSDGQAWAAGDGGVLFHRIGQAWTEANSPSMHTIYDLNFSSPSNGWAVGDGAQVLHWDGVEWTETIPYHAPGEGPGGSTQVLYAVDASSVDDAWMVGAQTGIDGKTSPFALHWNGTDLSEESAFPECNCGLNAVLASSPDSVLVVGGGDLGAIAFYWNGTAWSNMLLHGADHLYAISQAPDHTVYVAGIEVSRDRTTARGVLFRWYTETSWQRVAVPPLTGGIYALSVPVHGITVLGGDFTALRIGLDWQPITSDIAGYGWIVDIEVDPQGVVWALTRSGNLFRLELGVE